MGSSLLLRIALATPKLAPFTYGYDTLGEDQIEMEQMADLVPVKAEHWSVATQLQTEFEYGITNRLELGLYVSTTPTPITEGTGAKQRLRYRFADADAWPIDVGVYGEVVENDRELELEAKVILEKRAGPMRATVNLWAEREYAYAGSPAWIANPTAAVNVRATPSFFAGVEAWMRVEWPDRAIHPRPFELGPHTYVGPTMGFVFGRLWWTTAAYARLNDPLRSLAPDEPFGNFWFRTIVGVSL